MDLLHELPFYDELSFAEISKAVKGYAISYNRLNRSFTSIRS